MHETHICPLSHKYVQTQANRDKQFHLRAWEEKKIYIYFLPVLEHQRDTQSLW